MSKLKEKINVRRLTELFTELVKIDSPSFGERQMADCLTQLFSEMGFEITEDKAGEKLGGNAGNLLVKVHGDEDLEPVLFGCHMDTVPPAFGKRAIIREDGKITSAGNTVLGADDLSAVSEIIEALRVLAENKIKHRPVEIAIFVAEELHTLGSRIFDFSAVRAKTAYVLDLTGPIGSAAMRAPSIMYFKADITGKTAHAGFEPENGISAVMAAAKAISQVNIGHVDRETTAAVGVINGGTATNVVPERCTVEGEVRGFDDARALRELCEIQNKFCASCNELGAKLNFDWDRRLMAYKVPEGSPALSNFLGACAECGIEPSLGDTFGGSDANSINAAGIDAIVIANGMHDAHTVGEYTSTEELVSATELVLSLILR